MNTKQSESIYLSNLKENDEAVIIKVLGHGSFRKRITEMGFIKGQNVKVVRNAPLQDPIEYELMGYNISLRRSEARQIEVAINEYDNSNTNEFSTSFSDEEFKIKAIEKKKSINVALVGNPNCGKTTLFNEMSGLHEKVGNYGGVTVDAVSAIIKKNDYTYNIVDLPGTYSISAYSPEEIYVRNHIIHNMPDVVVNVVDATNLERNLFLTTQLIDMNIKVIIALNMYDEMERTGTKLDYNSLGKMLGIPIIPTIASKRKGINDILQKIIDCYEDREPTLRHVHIHYGTEIEEAISKVREKILLIPELTDKYCIRNVAINLLQQDRLIETLISKYPQSKEIINTATTASAELEAEFKEKTETIFSDAKYGFIAGALKETLTKGKTNLESTSKIDAILTNRVLGFPLFIIFLWIIFQVTFSIGSYPMDWIDTGISWISEVISNVMPKSIFRDLLINGIIGGVGGVIVFLPNILILFFFISFMEDTGYMARASFIMDKLMHKIHLHGKSFIPLIIGFGCNVPAIMATRILANKKDRVLTTLMLPFISCSARLPIYILLISAFFPYNQGLVLISIYIIGIIIAIISVSIINKYFMKNDEAPFVMELPPYRIPTIKNTALHMWHRATQYLKKMGGVILIASIIVWALGYFPTNVKYSKNYEELISKISNNNKIPQKEKNYKINTLEHDMLAEKQEKSYLGTMGKFIEPVIAPLGFDWKLGVSIISGFSAKEIVVSTMGVLNQTDDNSVNLQTRLQKQKYTSGEKKGQLVFSPLVAYGFMLFVLLYFPCIATITAIKKELGVKWAVFVVFYTTGMAWLVSFAVYQIGSLL
jgi:ferrous iron transport protein B